MRNVSIVLFALFAFGSCASQPPPPVVDEPILEELVPVPVVEPVLEVVEPEPEPVPVVVPEPVATPVFEVTPEKKQTSLAEIRALVDKLNALIAKKGFSEWKTYLDQAYLQTYGDPVRLKEYSASSPFLKQYNIKLKTLEDYFKFVVVPSRADVTVDDIGFVDENRVNVFTVVDNEQVLLYLLKLYGKEWKISSW